MDLRGEHMNTMTELERLTQEYEDLLHDTELAKQALDEYKAEQQRTEQQHKEFEALTAHVDCYNRAHGTSYVLAQKFEVKAGDFPPGVPLDKITLTTDCNLEEFAAEIHKRIGRYGEEN